MSSLFSHAIFILNGNSISHNKFIGPHPIRLVSPSSVQQHVLHDHDLWYYPHFPLQINSDYIWTAMSHLIKAGLVDWDGANHLPHDAIDGIHLVAAIGERLLYHVKKLEKAMTDLHCEVSIIKEMTLAGDQGHQGLVDHFLPWMWQIEAENGALLQWIEVLENAVCTCGLSVDDWEMVESSEEVEVALEPLMQEDPLISHVGNTSTSPASFIS
ncbi:hypothetical protein BDM02DRAFT_3133527 [Thelephora ganbajun]|uniref:Uncharacterized protein n=1 Tax=Thelephora ganbajun TaxID=370292 RepID=A0ACB6YX26_THEGA|nr:hypothetical protein BDM02DRAFT_3133527 [Thelephora ganbajun]